MIDFAEYIYGLKFEEEPNYNFLRFMLTKNLIDENQFPNLEFDWTQKIKLGKFNKFKDQYLNIIWANKNVQPKKVKLSKRIKELNLDQQFLVNQNVAESS